MKEGDTIAICPSCRRVVNSKRYKTFASRPIPTYDKAEEIGVQCPFCDHFQHLYFLNDTLRAMQYDNASRLHRREYARRFKKYQGVMRKRYYPSDKKRMDYDLSNSSIQSSESGNTPSWP